MRRPPTEKELLDELADLEWQLDPENSNPDPETDWVISRKLKVQSLLEDLRDNKKS